MPVRRTNDRRSHYLPETQSSIGAVICVAAFALVLVRLVDVTLLQSGTHRSARGFSEQVRADILDRNGQISGARYSDRRSLRAPACLRRQGPKRRAISPLHTGADANR
ncbi:MAG: hypothetical protein WDM89_16800 [Rhizomicrobium sp.]